MQSGAGTGGLASVAGVCLSDLFDEEAADSSDDGWRSVYDHEASVRAQQQKRLDAFCAQMQRIRKEGHIDDEIPNPDSHRGSPRAVRDLDDLNPDTGEPKFYPKVRWAAKALGVGRAHNVINAIYRNGRCGGHRVITDEHYWRSDMSLQKRVESKIKVLEQDLEKKRHELKRMKELNGFLSDPAISEHLIELDAVTKPDKKSASNGAAAKGDAKGEAEQLHSAKRAAKGVAREPEPANA